MKVLSTLLFCLLGSGVCYADVSVAELVRPEKADNTMVVVTVDPTEVTIIQTPDGKVVIRAPRSLDYAHAEETQSSNKRPASLKDVLFGKKCSKKG